MLQPGMNSFRNRLLIIALVALAASACAGKNENSHTTATTFVSPPPRQVLQAVAQPSKQIPAKPPISDAARKQVDPSKPLMIFNFVDKSEVHGDSPVVIDFSLANAKLKGDGGEYRVRYIVDDDEMKWIDRWEQIVLTGWTAGKHTIRLELIGPDGWPYKNGDYNIETRELTVIK
jgi:hypothetical protein